jgi:hypothetical protein
MNIGEGVMPAIVLLTPEGVTAPDAISRARHEPMHRLLSCVTVVRAIMHQIKTNEHEAVGKRHHREERRRPQDIAAL